MQIPKNLFVRGREKYLGGTETSQDVHVGS